MNDTNLLNILDEIDHCIDDEISYGKTIPNNVFNILLEAKQSIRQYFMERDV